MNRKLELEWPKKNTNLIPIPGHLNVLSHVLSPYRYSKVSSRFGLATPKSRFVSVSKHRVSTPTLIVKKFPNTSDAVNTISVKSLKPIITRPIAKLL